jgi:predicted AAA+ superfamily ATPase
MLDTSFPLKGILAENYVANQLVCQGIDLLYWRDDNRAEIDFLLDRPEGIIPVEVKAGSNKKSASLSRYLKIFSPPYAIKGKRVEVVTFSTETY